MSARLERERRSAKISKTVTFWIDAFSLKYCNSTSILMLSLESRANPAFSLLGGLLGGSRHHFGALWGASGDLLGVVWSALGELLWDLFVAPSAHLAPIGVHSDGIFGDFGSALYH